MGLNVALFHDRMHNKEGRIVTTALTPIDAHDIARSSRTFGVDTFFIVHPSPHIRKFARTLKSHWEDGFGASYNPNRAEAFGVVEIVTDIEEVSSAIDLRTGKLPRYVATSAKPGGSRTSYSDFRTVLSQSDDPWVLMLGTGWGMSNELLDKASLFLEPVNGPGDYNHLSVRSACAIMLDRLRSR